MSGPNPFRIPTASYAEQSQRWPQSGWHILAHFDDETIIVYQAYRPEIGNFAAEQRMNIGNWKSGALMTPIEGVYVPNESRIAQHIGLVQ